MKKICVLGANGHLANIVAKEFFQAGFKVIAITRNGDAKGLPKEIEPKKADAMDENQLITACEGADFIFNGLNPPYTEWSAKCLPLAKNVISAAKANQAVHLFPGNVYNYGTKIPALIDEKTAQFADTKKGRIRIEMEDFFEQESKSKQGVKTIILRMGDFYGGTIKGQWFDLQIASKLKKATFIYPAPLDKPHAWAYLPDVAKTFVALSQHEKELENFSSFNFSGHTLNGNQLKQYFEEAIGKKLKATSVPWGIIKFGGMFLPMWREISEMSYLWQRPHQLDGAKLQNLIGNISISEPELAIKQALIDLKEI